LGILTEKEVKLDPVSQVLYFEISPEEIQQLGVQPHDSIIVYFGKKDILGNYRQIFFSTEEELNEPVQIILNEYDFEKIGPVEPGDKLKVYMKVEKYRPYEKW